MTIIIYLILDLNFQSTFFCLQQLLNYILTPLFGLHEHELLLLLLLLLNYSRVEQRDPLIYFPCFNQSYPPPYFSVHAYVKLKLINFEKIIKVLNLIWYDLINIFFIDLYSIKKVFFTKRAPKGAS